MKSMRLLSLAAASFALAAATAQAASPAQVAATAAKIGPAAEWRVFTDGSLADMQAMSRYATTTVTSTQTAQPTAATLASSSGCWGQNSDTHTIGYGGSFNYGWEKLVVGGFCWSSGRLTSWGGDSSERWSSAFNCWTNTSGPDDWWYAYPTWRRAAISGDLGGNSGFGCLSLQHDYDWMGYGLNNGSPAWIKH